LRFESASGQIESYTYKEFDARTNQLANGLKSTQGLECGDRVIVSLANGPAFLFTWFALAKLGAVMVPVNIANTAVEMAYIIGFTEAKLVVSDADRLPVVREALERCGSGAPIAVVGAVEPTPGARAWDALLQGSPDTPVAAEFGNDVTAQILFTSGTTAQPKGVELTHAHCLWSGEHTAKTMRLAPGEINLTALPLFHVNAQSISVLATMTVGATLVLLDSYSASKFWEQVRRHRANVVCLVSALLRTLLAQPSRPDDRDHALRLINYALNCTDAEKREFEQRFGVELCNGYGLTEAFTVVTYAPLDGPRRWPSIGLPAIEREVKVVDVAGAELPSPQVGQILVRGTPGGTIFKGYFRNPEATRAALVDGWLHTGDQGWFDDAGYLHFFDRTKDVIKRGGENVSASEVESAIVGHPGVLECAVIGVPDPIKDEAVKAFVVARPGTALTEAEIVAYCTQRLAKFKVPQFVEFCDSLPKTSIGKIAKKLLRNAQHSHTNRPD
jgi:crotonobetaine/carnitine-CoA ligase